MNIAQVSPLCESVPPHCYGGTERIVSYLTESLVEAGHEVTLFASGDSRTRADLYATIPQAIRLSPHPHDATVCHLLQLEDVVRMADRFDVIHFHTDLFHFPLFRQLRIPQVTTLHGRLDLPDIWRLYDEFSEMAVVSISDAQRRPIPRANWVDTVYHGIPAGNFTFQPQGGDYFVFVGRISREKRPDRAIEIALRTGVPLKIAAKVDPADQRYFDEEIEPLLDHPLIDFVGEVNEAEKNTLLGGALALLFPIDWPEPFGLVMIEAMACGTPVVAMRNGSVDEVMLEGVSGRIVETLEEAIQAARSIHQIDRRRCREYFESRFTDTRMARDYVRVYQKLLKCHSASDAGPPAPHLRISGESSGMNTCPPASPPGDKEQTRTLPPDGANGGQPSLQEFL